MVSTTVSVSSDSGSKRMSVRSSFVLVSPPPTSGSMKNKDSNPVENEMQEVSPVSACCSRYVLSKMDIFVRGDDIGISSPLMLFRSRIGLFMNLVYVFSFILLVSVLIVTKDLTFYQNIGLILVACLSVLAVSYSGVQMKYTGITESNLLIMGFVLGWQNVWTTFLCLAQDGIKSSNMLVSVTSMAVTAYLVGGRYCGLSVAVATISFILVFAMIEGFSLDILFLVFQVIILMIILVVLVERMWMLLLDEESRHARACSSQAKQDAITHQLLAQTTRLIKREVAETCEREERTIDGITEVMDILISNDCKLRLDRCKQDLIKSLSSKSYRDLIDYFNLVNSDDIDNDNFFLNEQFNLGEFFNEMAQFFAGYPLLNRYNKKDKGDVKIYFRIQDQVKKYCVVGDRHYITKLLIHVIENAIDNTPNVNMITKNSGSVSVNVKGNRLNDVIRISIDVSDNGIGVKETELTYIFDAFYTTSATKSSESLHAGLGLTISHLIVNKMSNGHISAHSDGIGSGVTVNMGFELPVAYTGRSTTEKGPILAVYGEYTAKNILTMIIELGREIRVYSAMKTLDDFINSLCRNHSKGILVIGNKVGNASGGYVLRRLLQEVPELNCDARVSGIKIILLADCNNNNDDDDSMMMYNEGIIEHHQIDIDEKSTDHKPIEICQKENKMIYSSDDEEEYDDDDDEYNEKYSGDVCSYLCDMKLKSSVIVFHANQYRDEKEAGYFLNSIVKKYSPRHNHYNNNDHRSPNKYIKSHLDSEYMFNVLDTFKESHTLPILPASRDTLKLLLQVCKCCMCDDILSQPGFVKCDFGHSVCMTCFALDTTRGVSVCPSRECKGTASLVNDATLSYVMKLHARPCQFCSECFTLADMRKHQEYCERKICSEVNEKESFRSLDDSKMEQQQLRQPIQQQQQQQQQLNHQQHQQQQHLNHQQVRLDQLVRPVDEHQNNIEMMTMNNMNFAFQQYIPVMMNPVFDLPPNVPQGQPDADEGVEEDEIVTEFN